MHSQTHTHRSCTTERVISAHVFERTYRLCTCTCNSRSVGRQAPASAPSLLSSQVFRCRHRGSVWLQELHPREFSEMGGLHFVFLESVPLWNEGAPHPPLNRKRHFSGGGVRPGAVGSLQFHPPSLEHCLELQQQRVRPALRPYAIIIILTIISYHVRGGRAACGGCGRGGGGAHRALGFGTVHVQILKLTARRPATVVHNAPPSGSRTVPGPGAFTCRDRQVSFHRQVRTDRPRPQSGQPIHYMQL